MVGVMTILEGPLREEAKRLWQLFEDEYGSVGVQTFAHPNLTFGAGKCEDVSALDKALAGVTQRLEPFELVVRGIDAFQEPARVLFLSIAQTDELMRVHRTIHGVLALYCPEIASYYRPQSWVPHVTLAMGDLTEEAFNRARADLSCYRSGLRDMANNISLIQPRNDPAGFEIVSRHRLGAESR